MALFQNSPFSPLSKLLILTQHREFPLHHLMIMATLDPAPPHTYTSMILTEASAAVEAQ